MTELQEQGFGWVVLHPELLARPNLLGAHLQVIEPLLGAPRQLGDALVWEL